MKLTILILATAYLFGSIPFGYLLVRFFRKEDVRATGSGNIGATNVARAGGKGLGILTLALDLIKGLVAVLLAKHFAPAVADLAVGAAVAAVLGHVFPVWLRFQGGKGVATALGVFLILAPLAALGSLLLFILVVAITRLVSLASILAAVMIPAFAMFTVPNHTPMFVAGTIFIALLVVLKHHANMARLLQGKESKFGKGKATESTKVNA